jgi:glucose/arabinose dehydrogenase
VVLAQGVEEPMQFQILKDGRVIYAERKGKIKVYDPATNKITVIADFAVSTKYVNKKGEVSEGEDGMQGIILDPDYDTNHWIYVYYAPAGDVAKNTLERYTWLGKEILRDTKKTVLDVPTQREECCHVGGGMLFDKDKNLYLSTGDNTFSARQRWLYSAGRAAGHVAGGLAEIIGQHQRSARQDTAHPPGSRRHLHHTAGQPVRAQARQKPNPKSTLWVTATRGG